MNYFQRIRDIREDSDLSQAEVAKILGISQSDYSKYELGKHMMGIDKYLILARYYNVSLDYLTGLSDTPRTLDGRPFAISKNITITQTGNGNINIKN